MSRERQKIKQEEIKRTILDIARNVMYKEGVKGLSIRKITKEMDYSPAIIYHYFKDKNEIIEILLNEGYNRILTSIGSIDRNEDYPEKELREVLSKYIYSALEFSEEYKAFLTNDDPKILKKTALLERGISNRSKTMKMLCSNIKRGVEKKRYKPCDIELLAQTIWTSTFGLVFKLIIEKNIPKDQIERLIKQHINMIFNGIEIREEER